MGRSATYGTTEFRQLGSGTTQLLGVNGSLQAGGGVSYYTNRVIVTGGLLQVDTYLGLGGNFGAGINTNTLTQLSITGGRLNASYINIGNAANSNGTSSGLVTEVMLGGGTTTINYLQNSYASTFTGYTNRINWNGGVLRAAQANATFWRNMSNTAATIGNSGGIFDINSFNVAIAQNLEGTGALTVTNSSNSVGILTLSGSNTFNGLTLSDSANVTAGSANAFGSGTVTMGAGTLNLGGRSNRKST
jgi:fibronectin-binding autotransporter adhesin